MVLADLGSKISKALQTMSNSVVVDENALNQLVRSISMALLQADVDAHLVKKMMQNIKSKSSLSDMAAGANKRKAIQSIVIKELYGLLESGTDPFKPIRGKPNIIMFVGLQGAGKTTSCTKYAYYYKRKGFKVALVCADTYRAGAYDQLKQNAIKAKIPYYGSYTESDPVVVAEAGVEQFKKEGFDLIIVDTSGRHKQEAALFEEMQEVAKVTRPDDVIFVMDSSIGQAAKDQALAFRNAVDVGSVIITKLDGHAKGGGALSAVAATRSPITFIGTGEHTDDFEPFNPKSFVSRLLGMGDISGLLQIFEDNKVMENASNTELMKKIQSGGTFTFRDMYEQFQTLMNLGPLDQIMSKIPGLSQLMQGQGKGKAEDGSARIKRFMVIMDSFTQQELDSDGKLFNTQPNRIIRIARGAGVTPRHVQEVLDTFKPFKGVAGKLQGLGKGMDFNKMGNMTGRNGQANMRKMASMIDPRMLQQMGGMGNLQNLMSKFAGGMGGMPGMGGMGGAPGGLPAGFGKMFGM